MLYIFDTDHLTLNQRGDPIVMRRIQSFNYSEDQLLTTIVNLQEQFSGRFGTMDLRIASIALSLNATVITRNRKDFQQVPNLKFEDWSV
jgi:hypothetical protein